MADDVEEALRLSRSYEPSIKDFPRQEPELKEYRPSLKERIAAALMGEERPTPERRNFAEGLSELAYYVPGIGEAIAGDRLGRSIATEDYLTALKTALGVIPGTGKLVTDRLPKAFGGQAYANDMAMVGAKKGGRINTKIDRDPDWDMGLAAGGEVENALRLARKRLGEGGVPDESGEREFLQENLKGSAPQYVEQNDLPARVARGIEAADSAAGSVNDLAANALMIDAMRSPQGRKASEIITAPIPDDPNEVVKQAMRQYRRGDELGAAETMTESLPMTEMFIGKKAVLHPAERHAAEIARDMYDKGVDKGDILRHTRWFRGPEGPYRKEISDKSAEFFPDKVTGDDALHKIFSHDNLYERYPHLKDMSVVVDPNTKGDAYYSHGYGGKSPYIAISPEVAGKADLGRASLLHELQHAIQMHEDWAHGASPSNPAYQNIPKGSNPVTKVINSVLGRYLDPEVAYGRSLGEREAKNVEWRSKLPEEDLTYLHPLDTANHFYENSPEGPRDRFKGKVPSENELLVERPKDRAPMTLDEYLKTNPYAAGGEVDDALRLARASGGKSSAWTRKEGQNPEGGLNAKGRAAAKREGHNLKPPAPHPKNEKDAARRKSFCARMQGMKDELTSKETARDPESRINKSLRAWNCADGGAVDEAVKLASGGKPVWNKPRPKSLGKSEPLSKGQKASAKAAAKKAGRPYPSLIDNMNAARKGD